MRDFRRYQAMMESTIKAEVFAADPKLQKDPFKTGKDLAEKVGSGGFARPADTKPAAEADAATTGEVAATPSAKTADVGAADVAPADAAEAAAQPTDTGEEGPEQA